MHFGRKICLSVTNDVHLVIVGDRTYVPIRWIVENLGGHVTWNEETQQIVIEK